MIKLISERLAANSILLILAAVIVFHVLVFTGFIPYQIVWGGRLQSEEQMRQFETVSIALNLIMILLVAIKAQYLKINLPPAFLKITFCLMAALFAFNTVGNLFSQNNLEQLIFTPLTLLLAVLCFRLVRS